MNSDIKSILKAACQRSRKARSSLSSEEHFTMEDVDQFLEKKKQEDLHVVHEKKACQNVSTEASSVEKRVLKSASLSDILGFNPQAKESVIEKEDDSIPDQWKPFYAKLQRLKVCLKDPACSKTKEDLKLLEFVSDAEETLKEIDAAIDRMHKNTYGICEITNKPITEERLSSIPYTRYSLEGQQEIERIKHMKFLARMANSQRISDDEGAGEAEPKRPFYEPDEDEDLTIELEE